MDANGAELRFDDDDDEVEADDPDLGAKPKAVPMDAGKLETLNGLVGVAGGMASSAAMHHEFQKNMAPLREQEQQRINAMLDAKYARALQKQ